MKLYLARNSFLSLGAGRGLLPDKGANPDFRAFIGIVFEPNIGDRDGDGIKDGTTSTRALDEPEDFDGFEDEDGCPDPDNDRDGIPDVDDKCPNIPEDKDGVEDADGCPEGNKNDRDGDGIPDDVDKCPDEPEWTSTASKTLTVTAPTPTTTKTASSTSTTCARTIRKTKMGSRTPTAALIRTTIMDRILDATTSARTSRRPGNTAIKTPMAGPIADESSQSTNRSTPGLRTCSTSSTTRRSSRRSRTLILDAVAATLKGQPEHPLIEIQGHTDERGDDAYNLDLSDKRAHSVLHYLVDKGVDEKRLTAQGYGETQPIDRNHNEKAWAKNRRVAFLILKRATD